VNETGGNQSALIPGVSSNGLAFLDKQERGQGTPRFDAPGRHGLRDIEDVDGRKTGVFGFRRVDPGERGVGGTEVYANFHRVGRKSAGGNLFSQERRRSGK
jgi:hypothetical protein